jgi:hypothetical protein
MAADDLREVRLAPPTGWFKPDPLVPHLDSERYYMVPAEFSFSLDGAERASTNARSSMGRKDPRSGLALRVCEGRTHFEHFRFV